MDDPPNIPETLVSILKCSKNLDNLACPHDSGNLHEFQRFRGEWQPRSRWCRDHHCFKCAKKMEPMKQQLFFCWQSITDHPISLWGRSFEHVAYPYSALRIRLPLGIFGSRLWWILRCTWRPHLGSRRSIGSTWRRRCQSGVVTVADLSDRKTTRLRRCLKGFFRSFREWVDSKIWVRVNTKLFKFPISWPQIRFKQVLGVSGAKRKQIWWQQNQVRNSQKDIEWLTSLTICWQCEFHIYVCHIYRWFSCVPKYGNAISCVFVWQVGFKNYLQTLLL